MVAIIKLVYYCLWLIFAHLIGEYFLRVYIHEVSDTTFIASAINAYMYSCCMMFVYLFTFSGFNILQFFLVFAMHITVEYAQSHTGHDWYSQISKIILALFIGYLR